MQTIDGFLVLYKRQRGAVEGAEVFVRAAAVVAVEPHRTGSYVYVAGHKWDVGQAHLEITQAVNALINAR